ncbi:MAG: hydroxyacid aldolase [Rhizobiales bacterium]|nr:hydroxyacid aldolase [Hyphomicrobiales bacterium]MBI3673825.1 hydroxyacid aldolase [Hyphomicrobiales bacterium]
MASSHYDLKARLARPEPFLFSWMSIPSTHLAAQMARLPLDGVCLDMQHGMIGFSDAVPMIAAINAAGRPAIARILWNEPGLVGQVLDAGAAAVVAPMVNSRAEAEALVRAAKYPPLGGRSWGGYTALQASGLQPAEYLRQANRLTQVFAMIETVVALNNVEAIAATPGLDGLFVGPSDLSITLSNGAAIARTGAATLKAMERIAAAAKANNLVAGAFGGDPERIGIYLKLGYKFITAGVDVDFLQAGAAALVKAVNAN